MARSPDSLSLLLVEGHAFVRAGLRLLLSTTPGLSIVAYAGDLDTGLELARMHEPDVVLVGGGSLGVGASRKLGELKRALPGVCVIALADVADSDTAARAGADFCLSPEQGVDDLRSTVAAVLGERCAGCEFDVSCPVPKVAVALSRRERQVALRVAQGLTSKEIAVRLGIGLRTVRTYRESLARKLGASSAAVVTRFVIESGMDLASES